MMGPSNATGRRFKHLNFGNYMNDFCLDGTSIFARLTGYSGCALTGEGSP
jgi:hypothetical protein